jgi:hypothetical protein
MWWMRASGCHAQRLQAALVDHHHAAGAVADLAGVGGVSGRLRLQQLDAGDALQRGVEADAFVHRVQLAVCAPSAMRTGTGTISFAKAPACVAAMARWWLSSAKASRSSRVSPYFCASISAPVNWLNSTPG